MENKIEMIDINLLVPHPQNPRLEIGDVTELANSIKENGVLQNLTVVPHEEGYRVIIGHRRLTAAKQAGLTELPCIIREMTEKEQLKTMLMENIQREELDPYEQAQGFQLMIDLGETAKSIAKESGFSEKTVKHRLKMAELDKETLKKSVDKGVTIFDLIKLEKIKDKDRRNRVLRDSGGTPSFDYAVKSAVEEEQYETIYKNWETDVEKYIEEGRLVKVLERDWSNTVKFGSVSRYGNNEDKHLVLPEEGEFQVVFSKSYNGKSIEVLKVEEKEEQKEEKDAEREKRQEMVDAHNDRIKKLSEKCAELRDEFILAFDDFSDKKKEIEQFKINSYKKLYIRGTYCRLNKAENEKIENLSADKKLLYYAYAPYSNPSDGYSRWNCVPGYGMVFKYEKSDELLETYEELEKLGYQMSDDERQFIDGTHPYFEFITDEEEAEEGERN